MIMLERDYQCRLLFLPFLLIKESAQLSLGIKILMHHILPWASIQMGQHGVFGHADGTRADVKLL